MIKTSYTLHGMAKNSRYAIRVEAENQHGAGPSSEPLLVQTWPDVPSASPQNMQLESLRSGRIRVRWRAPPKDQWNGPLTGYLTKHFLKIYCIILSKFFKISKNIFLKGTNCATNPKVDRARRRPVL